MKLSLSHSLFLPGVLGEASSSSAEREREQSTAFMRDGVMNFKKSSRTPGCLCQTKVNGKQGGDGAKSMCQRREEENKGRY